jgi:hypothetical protein
MDLGRRAGGSLKTSVRHWNAARHRNTSTGVRTTLFVNSRLTPGLVCECRGMVVSPCRRRFGRRTLSLEQRNERNIVAAKVALYCKPNVVARVDPQSPNCSETFGICRF